MHALILLLIGFQGPMVVFQGQMVFRGQMGPNGQPVPVAVATPGSSANYARALDAKSLDQATLDVEGYGEKKALKREDDGLRITLGPGNQETGWKSPQALKIGGDFTISADLSIKTMPKPAQEDGVAVGLAIATQDINQPDLALIRLREPGGADVYRSVEKPNPNDPMQQMRMQQQMMMMNMRGMGFPQPNAKPPKPPRMTFPAAGDTVHFELKREGGTVRYQVSEGVGGRPRYLGQVNLGPGDIAALKLFATNRNGAEPINVLLRNLTIHADRITGLGTSVRTIRGEIVYGEPTSIKDGALLIGGQVAGTPQPGNANPGQPRTVVPGGATTTTTEVAVAVNRVVVAAPAPAAAVVVAPAPAPAAPVVAAPAAPADKPGTTPTPPKDATPSPAGTAPGSAPAKPPEPPKEKARIPLDEVELVRFERTPALTGHFLGQPNFDFTMPAPGAKTDPSPAKDETKKDETKKDETKKDETKKDETKKDETKKDETKKDETKKDETKKDETKKDETKKDETKKDETKKDETKKDETKKDETKKDETKKDETKKDETKKDETKKTPTALDVNAPPPGTAAAPTVQAKVEPKKNGIRDLQLSLGNLRNAAITQVTVSCPTDKGQGSWRLDTSGSADWPLVVRRSGTEGWADLFLEPPAGDCFEKDFNVAVTYADGQNANATFKASKHTDPKLAVDPKGPADPAPDAWVYLIGDEKIFGKLGAIGEETLTLTTPWQDKLDVPLGRIAGVHLAQEGRKETPESFARRLKTPGTEDLLLARSKAGDVVAISGVVAGSEAEKLSFRYQGKLRTLPLKLVEGLVMASRPNARKANDLRPTFSLPGGQSISGTWKGIEAATWKVETPWGQELKLPAPEVQEVRFRGGKQTFLSDLVPSKIEETPFFGRKVPYRRDLALNGEPLKMGGQRYERGLAVHSRSRLTYDLDGRYSTFEALVGFDDAASRKGRVDCRVFADGKELFANTDLRADGEPVKLSLPVEGAQQLTLLVDYGQGEDTGDRLIWADARIYLKAPTKVSATSAAPAKD
ncbi:NPCBM/NEW2 domain-containing protein [Isosphaeraceae bacterium EP7]